MALDKDAPKTRMVQLLDLSKITFGNRDENHKWIPGKMTSPTQEDERRQWCYFNLPFDCPAFLRVFRRLNVQKPGKKATVIEDLGTTLELMYFTFGVKLYVKHTRATTRNGYGCLDIYIEDGDGMTKVASYGDE